jgi:UDP-N-acetyl-D-mannosaminuronic acid dehydrogenase
MRYGTICVVGLGYIGLPTAAVFASRKVKVIGVDVNSHAVRTINEGNIHIVEPDLDLVVRATVTGGFLRATAKPEPADAFLIAVPTPFKLEHQPDLRFVEAASKSIAPVLKKGDLVILESTSPVGTTEAISKWLGEARPDLTFPHSHGEASDVRVAHCPERVLPGHVLRELVQNDRVIGGLTAKCSQAAIDLYKIFVEGECIVTDARTAEMCKLTENSFRDVNIAFANELSVICDGLGVNVWELIRLANRHPRVDILQPGPGVGGHCIAVDPWFIVHSAPEHSKLITQARHTNDGKPGWVVQKVLDCAQGAEKPVIACFGLAYKPDVDDLRESPAVDIVTQLARSSVGEVLAVEPYVTELPDSLKGLGVVLSRLEDALERADIFVLLVDHKPFRSIAKASFQGKSVVDTRGIWQTT